MIKHIWKWLISLFEPKPLEQWELDRFKSNLEWIREKSFYSTPIGDKKISLHEVISANKFALVSEDGNSWISYYYYNSGKPGIYYSVDGNLKDSAFSLINLIRIVNDRCKDKNPIIKKIDESSIRETVQLNESSTKQYVDMGDSLMLKELTSKMVQADLNGDTETADSLHDEIQKIKSLNHK